MAPLDQGPQGQDAAIVDLMEALKKACRRPLVEDVYLWSQNTQKQTPTPTTPKSASSSSRFFLPLANVPSWKRLDSESMQGGEMGNNSEDNNDSSLDWDKLCWSELLQQATSLLFDMTDEQYAQILHVCTVLYLGFLLPFSTGNEYRLLDNCHRRQSSSTASFQQPEPEPAQSTKFDPVEWVLNMPLLDRLNQLDQFHSSRDFGELDNGGQDFWDLGSAGRLPHMELAYQDFLHKGLWPLLSSRAVDREQVDLLHLIAMVVHPHPLASMEESVQLKLFANMNEKTQQLIRHPVAKKFHVHRGHRMEWVLFLAQHQGIVLPPLSEEYEGEASAPLLKGALPHLQQSFLQLADAATTFSAQAARAAWVALVSQTQHLPLLAQTWQILLHQIVDNPAQCHCRRQNLPTCFMTRFWPLATDEPPCRGDNKEKTPQEVSFCAHGVCGQLLAAMVVYSGNDLAAMALSSLTDTIEWQVDAWTKDEEDHPDKKAPRSPCLLSALLFAVRHVLLVTTRHDLEPEAVETCVESALALLRHPASQIRAEAIQVLQAAFANSTQPGQSSKQLFETLEQCQNENYLEGTDPLVRIMAHSSTTFAQAISEHFSKKLGESLTKHESRILGALWTNHPNYLPKDPQLLETSIRQAKTSAIALDLVAAQLAKRQTRYFESSDAEQVARKAIDEMAQYPGGTTRWDSYRMACHAMVQGDYFFATRAFHGLSEGSLSEEHFLWISALANVAKAEKLLAQDAAKAIPEASCHFHTAISYIHHLHTTAKTDKKSGFSFQSRYLCLRLDELDLIIVVRQLTREMRLTGSGPAKHTRHYQHLTNAIRSLNRLAAQWRVLNQQYGVLFSSGHSTTCLLAHEEFCQFLAKATHATFHEILGTTKTVGNSKTNKSRLALSKLMAELDKLIVDPMNNTPMEPLVRAAAMLELLDGLLMAPSPFPRDFFVPRVVALAELNLSAHSSEVLDYGGKSLNILECYPSISSVLQVNGKLPLAVMQHTRRPISDVMLWCRLLYSSPLDEDEATMEQELPVETMTARIPQPQGPYYGFSLLADGRFHGTLELPPLPEEGWFVLEAKLGCRDTRGAEWELHVEASSLSIPVHCSRSR